MEKKDQQSYRRPYMTGKAEVTTDQSRRHRSKQLSLNSRCQHNSPVLIEVDPLVGGHLSRHHKQHLAKVPDVPTQDLIVLQRNHIKVIQRSWRLNQSRVHRNTNNNTVYFIHLLTRTKCEKQNNQCVADHPII